jgi:hypothetical protein
MTISQRPLEAENNEGRTKLKTLELINCLKDTENELRQNFVGRSSLLSGIYDEINQVVSRLNENINA